MKNGFEEEVYNSACMAMGEAVWELVVAGEEVTQTAIANMITSLIEYRLDLGDSVALSVLNQT